MIGQNLGPYRIESKLGEGGMGIVWKARDPRLNRFIALKVLPPGLAENKERRARFIQEAQAASALNHPNIITIYDIGREGEADYIAMEYVEGSMLGRLIAPRGMKTGEVLDYAAQIAGALAAAHQAGIIHRDLKPSNIMVTPSGLVKVLDFGLAKLTSVEPLSEKEATVTVRDITEQGAVMGTAAYMSPEQAEGKPIDRRSDIFSLGAILYEMVAGHRPFSGDTNLALLSAIVHSEPKAMASPPPLELDRLIRRCLRKDPSQRFQHMDDLKISLTDLKQENESGGLSSISTIPAIRPPRRIAMWPALAAVVAVSIAIGAVWILSRSRPVAPAQLSAVRQFTFDSGLTTEPTWWAAGNMVAYASDRATGTNLDIWVQQIGGETRQLTSNPADDHEPDFSPDGAKVAFRSERDGGGIFLVSTLAGSEHRLTSTGYSPRFSPDGRWIAYWVGDVSRQYGLGKTFIIPASGGEPHEIAPKMGGAALAAWSPDSKHLLFLSSEKRKFEFYVQALDGGDPIPTGLAEVAQAQTLGNYPTVWIGNQFVFSAPAGDAINLFSVEIDPATFHARGPRQRLTAGTGIESRPLLSGNRLIYSSVVQNDDVWSVPIDQSTSKSSGEAVRLTRDLGSDIGCSISEDGTRLAWYSVRSEEAHLMARDLTTGHETDLTTVRRARPMAADISADGQRVAYTSKTSTPPSEVGFVIPFAGGAPEKVCDECTVRDWGGSNALLISNEKGMYLLDLVSRSQRQIAPSAAPARGFPDGRWWAAYLPQGAFRDTVPSIFVAPILPDRPVTLADLISITPGTAGDYLVDVAPDAATLFFLSPRDGFHCVWAQKIDTVTHHAVGDPFPVYHAHSARHSTIYVSGGMRRLTAARNKIVFTMAERTGNIWIADLPAAKR